MITSLQIPKQVWIEEHDASDGGACDVIIEMDDGAMYTAQFVTIPYLQRQMELSYEVSAQIPETMPVPYAVLETPHILVESTDRETIEDTIDNLLALDVFESLFTRVTEDESDEDPTATSTNGQTTNGNGKRATAEVAAVVISDVLFCDD